MQQIDYYLLHFLLSGYCKNPPGIQVDPKTRLTWLFLCPPPLDFSSLITREFLAPQKKNNKKRGEMFVGFKKCSTFASQTLAP